MLIKGSARSVFSTSLLFGGALTGLASASSEQSTESKIPWGTCNDPAVKAGPTFPPAECGNLTVPLDYSQPDSNATLELKLLRIPAAKQPSKGSVIVHFGGPSDFQTRTMPMFSEVLQIFTGQGFDLVTWDQRGTGDTLPFDCFSTPEDRMIWNRAKKTNLAVKPEDKMEFGRLWALSAQDVQMCHDVSVDKGAELTGTTYTARDVMQIVDALGGDRRLRFYGLSYGTILGSTIAAMFPERIERLVLDGVSNPHEYYYDVLAEMQTDSDKVFSGFLRTCFEKPDLCVLASQNPNSTAEETEAQIYEKIDDLKYNPIPLPLANETDGAALSAELLDHNFVKLLVRQALYDATGYPALAAVLHAVMTDDLDTVAQVAPLVLSAGNASYGDAALAIPSSDSALRVDSLQDVIPLVERSIGKSRLLGDLLVVGTLVSVQWKVAPKERFERGFHEPIELAAAPPLIIGNEYDVVTPYVSARNLSATFPGSAVIRFNTFGHGALNQASACTARAVRAYFENGTLPSASETVCEPAAHPWENGSWEPLWAELGYEVPNGTVSNSTS